MHSRTLGEIAQNGAHKILNDIPGFDWTGPEMFMGATFGGGHAKNIDLGIFEFGYAQSVGIGGYFGAGEEVDGGNGFFEPIGGLAFEYSAEANMRLDFGFTEIGGLAGVDIRNYENFISSGYLGAELSFSHDWFTIQSEVIFNSNNMVPNQSNVTGAISFEIAY
jgi:hypothetical protein